jgi:hypothetical protein
LGPDEGPVGARKSSGRGLRHGNKTFYSGRPLQERKWNKDIRESKREIQRRG